MFRKLWLSVERFLLFNMIRLFRIRRKSEEVARGFAIGLMIHFYPTFGFGVLFAGLFAKALGGNLVAGFVSGTLFAFVWPVLFYLNVKVGGLFVAAPVQVDDIETVRKVGAGVLGVGKAFTVGALLNSVLAGLCCYLVLRLLYERIRPFALEYFRAHSHDHQQRFRRPRSRRSAS